MFFVMRGNNRILGAGLILALMGSVAGCGASSSENTVDITEIASGGQTQEIVTSYEVPIQIPNILVDQTGYLSQAEKTIVFRGKELPSEFSVYSLDNNELVYSGKVLKPSYNEDRDEYNAVGYFNELTEEGSYYVYADMLGESYSFSISDSIYTELINEVCKKFYINRCGIGLSENYAGDSAHSACHTSAAHLQEDTSVEIDVTGGWHMDELADRDTNAGCKIAENFLLAYEMNDAAFTDEMGIPESGNGVPDILDEVRYEVEWLMKMQDSKTGGEYGAAMTDSSKGGDLFNYPVIVTPVSMDATISFAAMMARFSYLYQEFDAEFATECLKAADKAWNCYISNQNVSESSAAFKAAAQLYRATGNSNYNDVLQSFFEREDFSELFNSDEDIFIGSVTYLSTNQNVEVEQCGKLMKYLMKRSEAIAAKADVSAYRVIDDDAEQDFTQFLYDMRCLTITDHIIYNHEYTTIIQNHVHYLMGMNPSAINYLTDGTERTFEDVDGTSSLMSNPQSNVLIAFMLSVLVA